jgi:GNAT superfamily N-acetyltransferase
LKVSNGVVVRDAVAGELEELADLTLRAFREYRPLLTPYFVQRYEQDIQDAFDGATRGTVLVAELGGRLAGTATLLADGSGYGMHGWPDAWPVIRLLAVDPPARGWGAGTRLAETCVERARRLGVVTLGLHTAPFMTSARIIYEALGFHRAPEYDVVRPGSPPALAYRLELGGRV